MPHSTRPGQPWCPVHYIAHMSNSNTRLAGQIQKLGRQAVHFSTAMPYSQQTLVGCPLLCPGSQLGLYVGRGCPPWTLTGDAPSTVNPNWLPYFPASQSGLPAGGEWPLWDAPYPGWGKKNVQCPPPPAQPTKEKKYIIIMKISNIIMGNTCHCLQLVILVIW